MLVHLKMGMARGIRSTERGGVAPATADALVQSSLLRALHNNNTVLSRLVKSELEQVFAPSGTDRGCWTRRRA